MPEVTESQDAVAVAMGKLAGKASGDVMSIEAAGLVAALVEKNARDLAWTTNQLLAGYKRDYERSQATIAAIRENVARQFDNPWTPQPHLVLRALHPSDELIAVYLPKDYEA